MDLLTPKMLLSAWRSVNLPMRIVYKELNFHWGTFLRCHKNTKTCNPWHLQEGTSGNSCIYFSYSWFQLNQADFLTFLLFKCKPHHEESMFILRSQKHFLFAKHCRSPADQLQQNNQLLPCLWHVAMPGNHKVRLPEPPGCKSNAINSNFTQKLLKSKHKPYTSGF